MPSSRSTRISMHDVMCLILNKPIRFEPHTSVWMFPENSKCISLTLTPPTINKEKYDWLTRLTIGFCLWLAWYTLFTHAQSLLANLHTIRYTNHALTKQSISVYLLISHMQSYALCEIHSGEFKVKNAIALTATACIISFRVIDELQRKNYIHVPQCMYTWNR